SVQSAIFDKDFSFIQMSGDQYSFVGDTKWVIDTTVNVISEPTGNFICDTIQLPADIHLDTAIYATDTLYLHLTNGDIRKVEIIANGQDGKSLEYNWQGTQLGVRVEGDPTYTYTDLQGPQGIQGIQGPQGPQGDPGP